MQFLKAPFLLAVAVAVAVVGHLGLSALNALVARNAFFSHYQIV